MTATSLRLTPTLPALLVVVVTSTSASAQPTLALTSEEVSRRAVESSFELVAAEQARAAASAGVDQAQAGYYPRLAGVARYMHLSALDSPALGNVVLAPDAAPGPIAPGTTLIAAPLGFPVLTDQYTLQAQLTLPLSDYLLRVPHAVDSAAAGEQAAALDAHAARLRVATDARVLYYDWVRSRLQLGVAEKTLAQTQAHLADARRLAEEGRIPQADVLSAESQLGESELLLERARNLDALNDQRLRTAMHDRSGARYEIGENVQGDLPPAQPTEAWKLYREALERRLELKALERNRRALVAQGKLARSYALPRIDGLAEATYANPNQRIAPQRDEFKGSWAVGAQLSWTPSELPGSLAQGRGADARASEVEARRHAVEDVIRVEITRALQAEREASKAIETSARRLVAAEEAHRVRTVLFQNGRATGLEVTDAETELARARLDAIAAHVGLRVARVQLAHASGQDAAEL